LEMTHIFFCPPSVRGRPNQKENAVNAAREMKIICEKIALT
jgi:hypothetical protein